jgi:eukaryotic-like serine/threonine-protein kinase
MNPGNYVRVMQIVDVLMDCTREELEARISEECSGDDSLRREVEKLLAQDRPESSFLEESPLNVISSPDDGQGDFIGRRIGPYRLTEEIGRGGMGAVYKAVRDDDQYQTEVAIKLIKRGMDTDFILRRFRNERQILANLNHPNIARLLDGGTTTDGLPYFVMERIEGRPLDDYCDEHKLSTTERLKLFRSVCSAVQYAHQHLVIHRDLKPTNILITKDGTAKLLDFGIAKLLQPESDAPPTFVTATELRAMTPEYASPEQVKGDPITTSSDVYSLGVLLYELLTGRRPYRFKTRRADEVARVISEVEPMKPSLATADRGMRNADSERGLSRETTINQQSEVRNLKSLQGDIDNIVLKALRKEPERRYSSVDQLSEDIRRHLEGLPVSARKDTVSYRTQKFVQRHRAAVLAASLIVLALICGMAATLWQARVAQRERSRAERRFNDVRILANSFMFEFHDEIDKGPLKAKQLVVKKALEYLDSLAKEAGSDRGLQRELATAYFRIATIQGGGLLSNLNDTKGALESHRKALAIREALAKLEPGNSEILFELATSYDFTGELIAVVLIKPAEALNYFRKTQTILEPLVAANPGRREFRQELASAYRAISEASGNVNELSPEDRRAALELQPKAIEIYEALAVEFPTDLELRRRLASIYSSQGIRLNGEGKLAESVEAFRKGLKVNEALIAADNNNVSYRRDAVVTLSNIGVALLKLGDRPGSLDHALRALVIYKELAEADKNDGNARKDLAIGYRNLGQVSADAGDKAGSAESYRQAVGIFEDLVTKNSDNAYNRRQLALTYLRLSQLLSGTGDQVGSVSYASMAVTNCEKLIAANANTVTVSRLAADSYGQLGKSHALLAAKAGTGRGKKMAHWQEARSWYLKSLGIWQDMKAKGTLSGGDKDKSDETSREIARCDSALTQ